MNPPDALESLRAAHETLESLGVPHGLIGGWAVIAWGRVRATRDIDWLAAIPVAAKPAAMKALAQLGKVDWRDPGEDDPLGGVIRVEPENSESPVIDILLTNGAADRAALSRCVTFTLGKASVPTVRPEDIIAMKLQAGGGVDFEDARALLQMQAGKLDEQILREACESRKVLDRLALLRR